MSGYGDVSLNGRLVFSDVSYTVTVYDAAGGPAVLVKADSAVGRPYPAFLMKLGVYTVRKVDGGIDIIGG